MCDQNVSRLVVRWARRETINTSSCVWCRQDTLCQIICHYF